MTINSIPPGSIFAAVGVPAGSTSNPADQIRAAGTQGGSAGAPVDGQIPAADAPHTSTPPTVVQLRATPGLLLQAEGALHKLDALKSPGTGANPAQVPAAPVEASQMMLQVNAMKGKTTI